MSPDAKGEDRRTLVLILVMAALVLGAGGGLILHTTRPRTPPAPGITVEALATPEVAPGGGGGPAKDPVAEPDAPPTPPPRRRVWAGTAP